MLLLWKAKKEGGGGLFLSVPFPCKMDLEIKCIFNSTGILFYYILTFE